METWASSIKAAVDVVEFTGSVMIFLMMIGGIAALGVWIFRGRTDSDKSPFEF